ncbi:hypothetical protein Mgra_00008885 [Meloidogyne graminicola]|uniref:Uncharacterized protein n=1 Tax=Meloidogyne graminicola TaxID=189291 RepID=A0A8S9ZEH7_9BILA|nr:hypothetical protein Mgra_00008885 [Meloidogyne graminicola]
MYSSKHTEELLKCSKIINENISNEKLEKIKDEINYIKTPSPPIPSSPKINLIVPPNSVRSENEEINELELTKIPSLESPLSNYEEENYEKKKEEEEEEKSKINKGNGEKIKKNEEIEIQQIEITLTESSPKIIKKLNKNKEEKEKEEEECSLQLFIHKDSLENENKLKKEEKEEDNESEEEEIILTPSTGEGCIDSICSINATNGETPTKLEIIDNNNDYDDNDNEKRRVSSVLSRELINSVIELALENNEEIINENNDKIKINNKQKNLFQLELDKKVLVKQKEIEEENNLINNNNSFNNNSISGQSSPTTTTTINSNNTTNNNYFRDIHVRTSLNDPLLPFKQLAYTSFEPEKQEIIRKEINIFGRQKSAHFYIEKEQVPKQQEDQPKRKNTPHPITRQSSLNQPENENIIINNNKKYSRSEIIRQTRSFGSSDMQKNLNKNSSIWSKIIQINLKEPTPGSLAAIRLSLSSSITSTPNISPINYSPPNGLEKINNNKQLKEINNNNNLIHGKDGILPKNVGHFYRIWGSAQAQNAIKITEKQLIEKNNNNINLNSNE